MSQRPNRPNKPKPKPIVKEPVERTFKDKLTVEDLEKAGLSPLDLQDMQKDWGMMIKLLNALLLTGAPITKKIGLKELNKLQDKVSNAFL